MIDLMNYDNVELFKISQTYNQRTSMYWNIFPGHDWVTHYKTEKSWSK